ncbi:hypothetical protein BpHYR1_036732 [Brachionus plicatilis]|uniref:Uncharacterized protein n=1 Tax=Brachionus plicatilis TaxID=10195 RepID=A0A3M7QTC9_BRAPC|nr:hypothetical protein BpHYR1_036732 [Brachionus plicatilis]
MAREKMLIISILNICYHFLLFIAVDIKVSVINLKISNETLQTKLLKLEKNCAFNNSILFLPYFTKIYLSQNRFFITKFYEKHQNLRFFWHFWSSHNLTKYRNS